MYFIMRKKAMWPGELQRTFLQDPVWPHLDFTWTLRPITFLSFTMIQSNMEHAFLDNYTEAIAMYSRSCTDKDIGNFGGGLWLVAWWGAWEVLGLLGKEGSELRCSEPSKVEML